MRVPLPGRSAFLAVFFVVSVASIARVTEPYPSLVDRWKRGDTTIVSSLLDYRRQATDGRRWEVAFMLASSLCRAGRNSLGQPLFRAMLRDYETALRQAGVTEHVRAAADACGHNDDAGIALTGGVSPTAVITTSVGVTTSSKLFYWMCEKQVRTGASVVMSPLTDSEISARLYALRDTTRAVASIRRHFTGVASPSTFASAHFVIASASGHGVRQLGDIASTLERAVVSLHDEYGLPVPDTLISVYLVPDAAALRTLAATLHHVTADPGAIGYSVPNDQSIVAVIPGAEIGTLLHELTHLLVKRDFADAPPWLDEGFAALHEVSHWEGNRLVGDPNWRGDLLRELGYPNRSFSLAALLTMHGDDFNAYQSGDFERAPVNHALARYFVLQLQQTGRLDSVYRRLRRQDVLSDAIVQADTTLLGDARRRTNIEQALGASFADINGRFAAWLPTVLPKTSNPRSCREK
jgi:hypothetical protein